MTSRDSLKQGVDYEYIPHTADVGITVRAATLAGIYERCALILFEMLFDFSGLSNEPVSVERLHINADDKEMLLVEFLNELLYLFFTKHFVASEAEVYYEGNALSAVLHGMLVPAGQFTVKEEIKAATYHELQVKQLSGGQFEAQVIFDV